MCPFGVPIYLAYFSHLLKISQFLIQEVPHFISHFTAANTLEDQPLEGMQVGLTCETLGSGVDLRVVAVINAAASNTEELGCIVEEVLLLICCSEK